MPAHAKRGRTQLVMLAEHLGSGMSISPAEAKEVYGISRLAPRIGELRDRTGAFIQAVLHKDPTGKRYTRYRATAAQGRKWLMDYAGI